MRGGEVKSLLIGTVNWDAKTCGWYVYSDDGDNYPVDDACSGMAEKMRVLFSPDEHGWVGQGHWREIAQEPTSAAVAQDGGK